MSEFSYIAEKIGEAEFVHDPFPHLLIEDFLSDEHLKLLLEDKQVHFDPVYDDDELIRRLYDQQYIPQSFPGCTTDPDEYLNSLLTNEWRELPEGTTESFGMAFKINQYKNPRIEALMSYLNGTEFKQALERKFGETKKTRIDTVIQKHLTGYEISPHPDTKAKSTTYTLNINKKKTLKLPIHLELHKFKPEYEHMYDHWENTNEDREWVPWDWTEPVETISQNNAFLAFRAHNKSLHAIKLDYNHLPFQRTQIYGNLWY